MTVFNVRAQHTRVLLLCVFLIFINIINYNKKVVIVLLKSIYREQNFLIKNPNNVFFYGHL